MYWSVIGPYGAFLAEILTCIPPMVIKDKEAVPLFFNLVALSIFVIMGIGYYIMTKKHKDRAKFENKGS